MNKLIFLTALLVLTGCRKTPYQPDYTEGPLYSIPAEMKAWTMFKPGSYWIYLNETTNESDSSIYKYGPYFEQIPCGNCPVEQHLWFFVTSPVFVKFKIYGGADSNAYLEVTTRNYSTNDVLTYNTLIHPDSSSNTSGYSGLYKCLGVFNNFILNGNIFPEVIGTRRTVTDYYEENNSFTESYFARNIGLIKFRQHTSKGDTSWSLMKWHTVQ